jgi:hypothetical protein
MPSLHHLSFQKPSKNTKLWKVTTRNPSTLRTLFATLLFLIGLSYGVMTSKSQEGWDLRTCFIVSATFVSSWFSFGRVTEGELRKEGLTNSVAHCEFRRLHNSIVCYRCSPRASNLHLLTSFRLDTNILFIEIHSADHHLRRNPQ